MNHSLRFLHFLITLGSLFIISFENAVALENAAGNQETSEIRYPEIGQKNVEQNSGEMDETYWLKEIQRRKESIARLDDSILRLAVLEQGNREDFKEDLANLKDKKTFLALVMNLRSDRDSEINSLSRDIRQKYSPDSNPKFELALLNAKERYKPIFTERLSSLSKTGKFSPAFINRVYELTMNSPEEIIKNYGSTSNEANRISFRRARAMRDVHAFESMLAKQGINANGNTFTSDETKKAVTDMFKASLIQGKNIQTGITPDAEPMQTINE